MTNIDSYIDGKSISEMRVAKAVVFPDSLWLDDGEKEVA